MQGSPMCGTKMQITNSKPPSSPRSRRKPKWKLKFHHQALPQEYLNHYETWQNTQPPSPAPLVSITQTLCPPLVPEINLPSPSPSSTRSSPLSSPPVLKARPLPSPPSSVRLTDLPYMGEMILDNARPRRGRKPKKLDICHLIYKNYGTTVVDEPLNLCVRDFAIPTTNRLQPTTSQASNTMGSTILQHNNHSASNNQVSMCKFKFTSGAKPSLMEKKLLTSTQHMMRNHQPHQSPSPQPRQKPLDFLTQQQLLGKLLINEQAKSGRRNSNQRSDRKTNFTPKGSSSYSRANSSTCSTITGQHNTGHGSFNILNSMNTNRTDLASPFSDKEFPRSEIKTEFPDSMDFGDPMMSIPSPRSELLSLGSDMLSPLSMGSDVDMESDEPDYNPGFSLPPLSPDFQRSLSETHDFPRITEGDPCDTAPTLNRRKSRKSQAREKLEKTFKEKGFLIQTQQLESAEGATYCKFRQLKKFTRYLFRNWKTHLPGEVVNETYNMQ